jgi:hypothetical protein
VAAESHDWVGLQAGNGCGSQFASGLHEEDGCRERNLILGCSITVAAGFAQLYWVAMMVWLFALGLWAAYQFWLRSHY